MIRTFRKEDLEQINNLYFALFTSLSKLEPDYIQPTFQKEDFLDKIVNQEDGFIGYLYEENNTIKGFAIGQMQTSAPYDCFFPLTNGYLMDIVVNEDYRGQGIGKQLIETIKNWAKGNNADYLELNVLAKNTKAFELYKKEDFEPYSISMRTKL